MNKLLTDTRLVAALVALAVVCLTVLAATKVIPGSDAYKVLAGLITGVLLAWQRGTVPSTKDKPKKKAEAPAKEEPAEASEEKPTSDEKK